jgi:N utilization substance protein B
MDRHSARRIVLELLYQHEFSPELVDEALAERSSGDQQAFIAGRVEGVRRHLEQLDGLLAPRTQGWRYERLAAVDRAILRLGAYELLLAGDVPPEVVLDEAVELCKAYGSERCGTFVNGILARLWKERSPALTDPATGC